MNISHAWTAVAFALIALPPPAEAAGSPERDMFEQLDVNGDASIDRDEAARSAQVTADFAQIDTGGDGRISFEEWRAYFGATGINDVSSGASPGRGGN